ncbi:MAG: 50S ribosome-binding GTPase, partial [Candidatus Pacebacteria bacterium]|nr:50S ribosome-binding GTPase [Candidatus Paceibacterota bacterium]
RHGVGYPGSEQSLWLRLKLIADAGLVGLPNAGKSSFLARVTRAKPKIADYPFTTLVPQLGVVGTAEREFVLADLPGLIEGASEGIGLGDRFLGHVERCTVVLHIIDGTADDPVESWRIIRHELAQYGNGLADKPEILILNKIDAMMEDEITAKQRELELATGHPVRLMSGVVGTGTERILHEAADAIIAARQASAAEAAAESSAAIHSEDSFDSVASFYQSAHLEQHP